MTTTVFDRHSLLVTSDTRWSAEVELSDGKNLLFVDDTGFNKIVSRPGAAMVLAGNGRMIAALKSWWGSIEPPSIATITPLIQNGPPVTFMIVSIEGDILFDVGHKLAYTEVTNNATYVWAVFFGSGGEHAANCWHVNRCASTAVVSASQKDPCTSADVKHLNFKNSNNNLNDETNNYQTVETALSERGLLMRLNDRVITPLQNHPDCDLIKVQLAQGNIVASAPMGKASPIQWDGRTLDKLSAALDRVAEIEKSL